MSKAKSTSDGLKGDRVRFSKIFLGCKEERGTIDWKVFNTSPRGIWLISSYADGWFATGSSGDGHYRCEVFHDNGKWSYACSLYDSVFTVGTCASADEAKERGITACEARARSWAMRMVPDV